MSQEKLVLWKPRIAEYFPNGRTPEGRVDSVGIGGHMHANLGELINFLKENGREWSIARVVCNPEDVKPAPYLSLGWYEAVSVILTEGFLPLEEAQIKYLNQR